MNAAEFESIALAIGIPLLIGFMLFIIYDFANRSNAGTWGMFVLFFALGLGTLVFIVKTVLFEFMDL